MDSTAPAAAPSGQRRFWGVTFCSALVLLIETVLFHVVDFIHGFFSATSLIGYTVIGIGIGAFAASRVRMPAGRLLLVTCLGTTLSLYATAFVLVREPRELLIAALTATTVAFPVAYITVLFRQHPGGRVYLFDMAGAFLGVLATAFLYQLMSSETIITLLLAVVPLVGLVGHRRLDGVSGPLRGAARAGLLPLAIIGLGLFGQQVVLDSLNIYKIFDRDTPGGGILRKRKAAELRATYDSLVGRIDILQRHKGGMHSTAWNGRVNDFFTTKRFGSYARSRAKGVKWPSSDLRVLYGLTEAPQMFIIGAAARGITKTAKRITPPDHIMPVEIQPGIVKAMTRDFVKESGNAYGGLTPVLGNAISVLKGSGRKFDIITMINTHAGRNIGVPAGPDHLHTAEQYDLYLDHLSDEGYMLFEERGQNRGGELGLYRMLNTAWHVLRRRGVEDPSKHFFIWEWHAVKGKPAIHKRYRKDGERIRGWGHLYIGMIISREPLVGELRDKALAWYHEAASLARVGYLKGYLEIGEWSDVMGMIEEGDFSALAPEGFDEAEITVDRPFASLSRHQVPQVDRIVRTSAIACGLLGLLFLVATFWRAPVLRAAFLGSYNILIGFGYFLIEIALIHAYQNIFVSAAWSLILVLGFLLASSGLGGVLGARLRTWQVTILLIPTALAAIHAPEVILSSGLPVLLGKVLGVAMICATGFLMGVYFPRGLVVASGWSLDHKVPYLFALNSVSGAFAVTLALWCGVHIGYQATILLAVLLYCGAGLLAAGTDERTQVVASGS
jgi:hypothetical protein